MNRDQALHRLREESFDVAVIGGGATGTGVALDAASRGLKVALVEQEDFAAGTSSRSTKLIHGGVRYLELAVRYLDRTQYHLVKEALHERATLLNIAPHLVRPLALVTPLYRWTEAPYYLTGLKLYDWIAGKSGLPKSRYISSQEALERFPMLKRQGLRGGVVYYDAQFNDARMNVALALTAARLGAVIANHVSVTGFQKQKGKLTAMQVRDEETASSWWVRAKAFINASGPHADHVRRLEDPSLPALLKTSSGSHIILGRHFAPPDSGLLIPKTQDGRVLFLLPWLGHTLVGTTDNPAEVTHNPKPSPADIAFILKELERYFAVKVGPQDILAAWCGLRPLVAHPETARTARLSRDHLLDVSPAGLITITGGKWTTYRKMAMDAVDRAIKAHGLTAEQPCRTHSLKLMGAETFDETVAIKLEALGIAPDCASHLASSYGDEAFAITALAKESGYRRLVGHHPYLVAEVTYAARVEMARSAVDVLARRLRLMFLDEKAAGAVLPEVTSILAQELGWDEQRRRTDEERARHLLPTLSLLRSGAESLS